jgi:RNA polymerase sigma factor (sigma-70 family)
MAADETDRLVKAAAAGDVSAWQALVERFSGLVWSVVRGHGLNAHDCDDVFQTTWLRLAEHLERIDKPDRIGAWLATTTRREAVRVARTQQRVTPTADQRLLDGPPDDLSPAAPESPEQAALAAERDALADADLRRLHRAFQRIPQRCRSLLRVLMASPPPSYAEVAAALDMPVGSIGPSRARCLRTLRGKLEEEGISGAMSCS